MSLNRDFPVLVSLALTLTLTLAFAACGKGDPEPTTKTAPLKASGKPEAAPAPAKAEAPTDKAAGDKSVAAPQAAKEAPEIVRVALPDDVVAVLAFRSLDSVLNSAKTALELLDPANAQPGFISATKEGIKESLGWKDIGWIQADKPIRSMLFNAKQYEGKAQFLALPMVSKDAVLAALPDGAKQKEGEHVAMYDNNGQTVYVDFVEGHAIYTDHASFFAKGKEFFEKNLRAWEPSREVELKLDLDNIYGLFLPELSEAKRQLLASYSQNGPEGTSALDELLKFEIATLFSLFESSHQADINLWLDGQTLHASTAFLPKAETVLDRFTKKNANKRSAFAKKVPKRGYFNSAVNLDFRSMGTLMEEIDKASINAYKQIADLRPEDIEAIAAQLKVMSEQSLGDAILTLYVDGEFPAAFAALTTLDEPTKVRAAYETIVNTLIPRIVAKAKAEGAADIPPQIAKAKTVGELLPLVNELGGPLGLKVAMLEEDKDGVSLVGIKVHIDWARFVAATGMDKADPEFFAIMKGVLGDRFSAVLGIKDKLGSMTFGPNAVEANKALLTGAEFGGGESGLLRVVDKSIGSVSIRMDTLLKALSFVPSLGAKRDLIMKVPTERPLIATMESNGKSLRLEVGVPVDVMQAIGEVQKN